MSSTSPLTAVGNLVKGALIGMAELVPGISGGTVALIVGIYERALHNGNLLIDAVKDRSAQKFKEVDWPFLIAIALGMVGAVFGMSTVMHSFVENYPEISKGLFLGMVAVSILVPLGMVDPREAKAKRLKLVILFALGALAAFFGTGFTSTPHENPSLIMIFFAAMVAVCALILPGLSGSFLLLAMGLYSPVMESLSNREWDVILVFVLGAVVGVTCFVKFLDWLLSTHRTVTLIFMAGLMLGSLRALWPWQTDHADLLAPYGNQLPVWFAVAVGALAVAGLLFYDYRQGRSGSTPGHSEVKEESDPQ
ncbi:DUF368 domain-containing protein [Corynebacterium renale]|uniref:Putative membrane protein n=1 Tax=Corynebacterium renale TaxID=1724 RepID=A0A2A9DR24_9CORY|nr:DUF368 domain-containing protein [Corynebacterium renale]PFG28816.1 putative membrane protein [Corynebacterium renale]SQI25696.1 predicted membrane protein [Corynebacterium renale]